jgi:hypothetical protein
VALGTDRRALIELLSRWGKGEVSARQVVEESEAAEEALFGEAELVPELPRNDPQSIPVAVLELMATAPHQRLLPEDVPALIQFLETMPGSELAGWQKIDAYWECIDFESREAQVDRLYFSGDQDGGAA